MVREVVARYLERDGYEVHELADGDSAARWLGQHRADLVILDVMLPERDGLSLLRELRRRDDVPVILLTARTDEIDRVTGLELGADDYVVKPFSPRELVARVRTVLRRAHETRPAAERIEVRDLVIELTAREVHLAGRPVSLTAKEFDLLALLARWPRQVFSRAQLLEQVWDSSSEYQDPATVTVHVGRLRQKLERDPDEPQFITTVRGIGYRFEP